MIDLRHGDCIERIREMEDNSIDLILTDPPYELNFMGKGWDNTGIAFDKRVWEEAFRVLKPGGYLMAFSGTRTYHRMAITVEEAGFEIKDMIEWVYGSGFPKSLDISKALDKKLGAERKVVGQKQGKIDFSKAKKGDTSFYTTAWQNKEYITLDITKPSSDIAKQYEGYKTSLKPSREPIIIAKKKSNKNNINFLPFIYCAKASKKERNSDIYGNVINGELKQKVFNGKSGKSSTEMKDVEKRFTTKPTVNNHPTVKPVSILKTCIKQVLKNEDMTILDMFAGSGSTGIAIEQLNIETGNNHKCILVEKEQDYIDIIKKRCCIEELD